MKLIPDYFSIFIYIKRGRLSRYYLPLEGRGQGGGETFSVIASVSAAISTGKTDNLLTKLIG
jgi:hypothetical protein